MQVSLPLTMMVSLLHSASHSSMLCEVSTTERPAATTACTRPHTSRRAPGSMLVVGSSWPGTRRTAEEAVTHGTGIKDRFYKYRECREL